MRGGTHLKSIIAMLLLLSLLLCGCSGNPDYSPTGNGLYQDATLPSTTLPLQPESRSLTLAYYADRAMNPYEATEISHKLIFSLVYQGLFAINSDYQASPVLCKTYTVSQNLREYVFYPSDATFPDGSALTAEDIAASLEAARMGTVYSGRLIHVSQIAVTEDGGVQVLLNNPCQDLPLLLDIPIVKADQVHDVHPAGTGPYYFSNGLVGLYLARRSNWWCRATLPLSAPYISLLKVDSPATMRDDFEFRNIDVVLADLGSDTYVDYRCDYELWDVESGVFLYLACNENSTLFSDRTLRAALTYAIDRDLLVSTYYRGFAMSASLPASPYSDYYDEALAGDYAYDPDRFAQAVSDAQSEANTILLLVNKADSRRVRVAKAIAKMLEGYGFVVTVSALSGTAYTNALNRGYFDLHLGQTKLSANMDLSAFFAPDGSLNFGGMADAATYSLMLSAVENRNGYAHLYKRVMSSGMLCPILFRTYAIYVQRGVFEDLTPAKDHIFYYDLGRTLESAHSDWQ